MQFFMLFKKNEMTVHLYEIDNHFLRCYDESTKTKEGNREKRKEKIT